ncbi:hypothetical protein AAKU58_003954 [Oxalobacteraceae bacterium GrIS 1.18]
MNNKTLAPAEEAIVRKNQTVLCAIFIVIGLITFSIGLPLGAPIWAYFPTIATASVGVFGAYLKFNPKQVM